MWILIITCLPCWNFCFFANVVSLKVVRPLKIYYRTKISWSHFGFCKFCIHLRNLNVPLLPCSKACQRKLWSSNVCPWYFTAQNFICLKCNSLWVVSIKQNVNFNFHPPAMLECLFFANVVSLKVVHSYKISCSHIDFCKFCIDLRSLNVPSSPCSKACQRR
jgi:hypothetical protein